MSQANRPCGAPIDFDVTKLQEPCRAAAAASQCAPLNQRAIARLNELRDRLERERRLSEALDEQGRKILVLQDESEENARKLREKIRRLVFSPDPDELA